MYKPKVFFTASFSGKSKYQDLYDQVLKSIQNNDVDLIATELGNYKAILTEEDTRSCNTEREIHYLAIKKGINWADLVILELSHESFQVGHEATLALDQKKNVLGLSIHKDWSETIKNKYFHGAKYTKYFCNEIIQNFITRYSDEQLSERFNLFLSKRQMNKLENLAQKNGVNKSEYLRELLDS